MLPASENLSSSGSSIEDGATFPDSTPMENPVLDVPEDDSWDEEYINFTSYETGPGKTFQEQRRLGNEDNPKLKISNIPKGTKGAALRRECETYGTVVDLRLVPDNNDDEKPWHAFVTFATMAGALAALHHFENFRIGNHKIRAVVAKTKEQKMLEKEERRKTNELLRECGYTDVRDDVFRVTEKICALCGRDDENLKNLSLKKCTGCNKVYYCSKQCASKHRLKHKSSCSSSVVHRASRPAFPSAVFKTFENNASYSAIVWNVFSPDAFGLIPDDDEPADYFFMNEQIEEFANGAAIHEVIDRPNIGELVIARSEAEDAHRRAVVVDIHDAVVDLWFVDEGIAETGLNVKELLPIREFVDFLRNFKRNGDLAWLNVDRFKRMPARVIPCFLHAIDPDTGRSRKLEPITSEVTNSWSDEAISVMKKLTSQTFDVVAVHRSGDVFPKWGVQLSKDLGDIFFDVGETFVEEGMADFEPDPDMDGSIEKLSLVRVLPETVPRLPIFNGPVLVTHFESPSRFYAVNIPAGVAELERMPAPLAKCVENAKPFSLEDPPSVGDLVIAPLDRILARATVLDWPERELLSLFFIDWGSTKLVPLSSVYPSVAEIASFACPTTLCGVVPEDLDVVGGEDIARAFMKSSAGLKIIIASRKEYESEPRCLVTLSDGNGVQMRNVVHRLLGLPRLRDLNLRRDLFLKEFSCEVRFFDDVLVDFVVVALETSEKLQRLEEELACFFPRVTEENYFLPRAGRVVVGMNDRGDVRRYELMEDARDTNQIIKVRCIDYGFEESISVSSLRRLPPSGDIADIPVQTFHSRLKDAPVPGSPDADHVAHLIKDAVECGSPISCRFDRILEKIFVVELFVNGQNIKEMRRNY